MEHHFYCLMIKTWLLQMAQLSTNKSQWLEVPPCSNQSSSNIWTMISLTIIWMRITSCQVALNKITSKWWWMQSMLPQISPMIILLSLLKNNNSLILKLQLICSMLLKKTWMATTWRKMMKLKRCDHFFVDYINHGPLLKSSNTLLQIAFLLDF